MTIRFAGARVGGNTAIQPWRCRSVTLCPANDNVRTLPDERALFAALRYFAHHGIGAAEHAATRALSAQERGDQDDSRHWLAVCRQLDRRLADGLSARLGLRSA